MKFKCPFLPVSSLPSEDPRCPAGSPPLHHASDPELPWDHISPRLAHLQVQRCCVGLSHTFQSLAVPLCQARCRQGVQCQPKRETPCISVLREGDMSTRGGEGGRGSPEIRKIAKRREQISGETQKTTPGAALPSLSHLRSQVPKSYKINSDWSPIARQAL